jgi:hypothetical protein
LATTLLTAFREGLQSSATSRARPFALELRSAQGATVLAKSQQYERAHHHITSPSHTVVTAYYFSVISTSEARFALRSPQSIESQFAIQFTMRRADRDKV